MRAAEAAAMTGGVSAASLMEKAGRAVAAAALKDWSKRPVAVICGPGNNGGDGFVVARVLADAGWDVTVCLLGKRDELKSDAKLMADLYEGEVIAFTSQAVAGTGLIIDAIFGAGLSRDIEGETLEAIKAINSSPAPVLAIDVPSGIDADTGAIRGGAVNAMRTVTFFTKKPGHVLFPGRAICGAIDVIDIGIPGNILEQINIDSFENQPTLWARGFPRPGWGSHKYHRGHVFVVSGGRYNTGAVRLAASGAQRMGAGLVTMLSPPDAADIHAHHLRSIMLRVVPGAEEIGKALSEKEQYRRIAVVGPAGGVGEATRTNTLAVLAKASAVVVDADALTSFANSPAELFSVLRENDVLTPHEGEFAALFSDIPLQPRLSAARAAAAKAGCVVVLKGSDTIIAAPDGRVAINSNAPPDLAIAGSGDVLAGLIAGALAQGMAGFEAAAAGVWFHGAAAQAVGPGMIADDLPNAVPAVLRSLMSGPQEGPAASPENNASAQ